MRTIITGMKGKKASLVIRLGDQEVFQETNLKTMVRIIIPETGSFGPGTCANHGQNSTGGNSSAEINRLSSEMNSRLSRELDDMMSSVITQIQRAINDAISGQILPQIQSVLNAGSGQSTLNKWNVPSERPEVNSEETYGE